VSEAWFDTLGVFDLETTGIDVETSRVVSAHVGVIGPDGGVLEQTDWLADPGVEIPVQASAVHGITTERARAEGRPAAQVVAEIVSALADLLGRGIAVTIYNAPYDLSLLNRDARRHGVTPLAAPSPIIDPLVIDKAVDRYRKGKRTLEVAAEYYGVSLLDAHSAGADAVAAGRVAQALALKYPAELAIDVTELHAKQVAWSAQQAESFQEYMRRERDPRFVADGAWPER
jgi:DNA polymerase III subunit epsilon